MFRAEVVSIIAGGRSVRRIDRSKIPGFRIGVNDSFIHAECDVAVSMDRLWTENRWAALHHEAKPAYIRTAALKLIEDRPAWLREFECDIHNLSMSESWTALNGNNSGFCALNLAYLARPRKIYLFGFDMTGSYWYPKYSWQGSKGGARFGKWAGEFVTAARQLASIGVEVVNVSPISEIRVFRKIQDLEAVA